MIFEKILKENDVILEIFIKHEGGHQIISRALDHYKKRISTITSSPELSDSGAMFGMILQQEAAKIKPKVDSAINLINSFLSEKNNIEEIKQDLPLYQKSLISYKTDIIKAKEAGQEYYLKLVGNIRESEKDLSLIESALIKIQGTINS